MSTQPFKNIGMQRVWSIILIMAGIFLIFYTPSITLFTIGVISVTHNMIGIIVFLVGVFYLLTSLDLG